MIDAGLVSVIIPVYNVEDYLKECIDSVLQQTYSKIEIILLDDGSLDNSLQICKQYADLDQRICVYHQENLGVSVTRNRGIDLARGNYILFVDADDIIDADMIEKMLLYNQKNYITITNLGKINDSKLEDFEVNRISKEYGFWDLFERQLINSPCNKLYETVWVKDGIRFEEGLSLGEDLLFNLNYLKRVEGFVFLDKPFYHYRNIGNQSLSHKYHSDGFDIQHYLYMNVISFCKMQVKMTDIEWDKLYWEYFKALQKSLDDEYEHNGKSISDSLLGKINGKVFNDVFQRVYQVRKSYRLVNKMELWLYKHRMWKVDYKLRCWKKIYRSV